MKKSSLLFIIWAGVVLGTTFTVFADSEAGPIPFCTMSGNGKYLFVMLTPGGHRCFLKRPDEPNTPLSWNKEYEQSGMYEVESTDPLWTVDWYSFTVFVSNDGSHVVRRGPWAKEDSDEALSFVAEGKIVKTYQIRDIVRYPWALPHTVSHFLWGNEMRIDEGNGTFKVTTLEGGVLVFDLKTGEIINRSLPIFPPVEGASIQILYFVYAYRHLLVISTFLLILATAFLILRRIFRGR